ncbi:hypothetical protein [Mycolicibacterium nivoides]|uniref:hypothetical protein n=1 Tax=Mycolicibacterium nivoides TaxID=2487344 RepID=UPI000F5B9A26|nr:hypothetical protein [Mycolicibacterium nivoides]
MSAARDDALAKYGHIAMMAAWETPVQSAYGIYDQEVVAVIHRLNNIARGQALLSALADEGLMITAIPTKPEPVEYPIKCVCGELISPDTPYVEEDVRPGRLWHGNAEGGGHASDVGVKP